MFCFVLLVLSCSDVDYTIQGLTGCHFMKDNCLSYHSGIFKSTVKQELPKAESTASPNCQKIREEKERGLYNFK